MTTKGRWGRVTCARRPGRARLRESGLVGCVIAMSALSAFFDPVAGVLQRPGALGITFALAYGATLLARRHAPMTTVAVLSALAFVHQAWGGTPTPALPALMVGLHGLALHQGRRPALIAAALVATGTVAAAMLFQTGPVLGPQRVGAVAWIGLATAVGDAVRNRRAYVRALEERAERAERTREEEAARRVAAERMRIARELHDVVAHELTLINAQAGIGVHVGRNDPVQMADLLTAIRDGSRGALGELRAIVGLLAQPEEAAAPLEPAPGLGRLEDLVLSFERAGLMVEVVRQGAGCFIPSAVDATGYRIIQEALTNVRKHSGVDTARVAIDVGHDALSITVDNEGPAGWRPPNGGGTGRGLIGIRERVAAVGGTAEIAIRPQGGFSVAARLPLSRTGSPQPAGKGNDLS
ncbi:sensor histidine kinase [Streptomyces adelaidensis]|uniref:sensor histidine kinase n=1 Tax=Streptomyces adelaidensis TaxID=2796465 RepID=UPI00190599EB|nr:histidine kinase [Streptomyces adelaidensis]